MVDAYAFLLVHHDVGRPHSVVRVHDEFVVVKTSSNLSQNLMHPLVSLRVTQEWCGMTYRIVPSGWSGHRRVIVEYLVTLANDYFVQQHGLPR